MQAPTIQQIKLRKQSACLELTYDNGEIQSLPFEYLRVFSPSAEVKGHGPGQEVLQTGKANVRILHLEPVGNYAIQIVFDDGHDSGIYSWSYLYELGQNQEKNWSKYLEKLELAGKSRHPIKPSTVTFFDPSAKS